MKRLVLLVLVIASWHASALEHHRPFLHLRGGERVAATNLEAVAPASVGKPSRPQRRQLVVQLVCLYIAALVNGLNRRALGCSAPLLEHDKAFTLTELDALSFAGYRSFALGRACAGPLVLKVGSKMALLLQLLVMTVCQCILAAGASVPSVVKQAAWMIVRAMSAMSISIMVPMVRSWVPRNFYGRTWALLQSGIQSGGLLAYEYYSRRIARGGLHWRQVHLSTALLSAMTLVLCSQLLDAKPTTSQPKSKQADDGAVASGQAPDDEHVLLWFRSLLSKFVKKRQFWLMLIAVSSYMPIYEYGSFITQYLRQLPGASGADDGVGHCIQSKVCSGRYGAYQKSYIVSLLLGSFIYDRCSQLDKALMILGLMSLNVGCWGALVLSDTPLTAAPFAGTGAPRAQRLVALVKTVFAPLTSAEQPISEEVSETAVRVILPLTSAVKTMILALCAATIAIPSSLPFVMFAIDFGKEGAALLSSILSMAGSFSCLTTLYLLPITQKSHGWPMVHTAMMLCAAVAAVSLSTVMFADQRKFRRGYIIRSSLFGQSVVTLHACSRPECQHHHPWRPGAARPWAIKRRLLPTLKPFAPTRVCHCCGMKSVVEFQVDEGMVEVALRVQYSEAKEFAWQAAALLKKPKEGWSFSDPARHPLATDDEVVYGDPAFWASKRQRFLKEEERLEEVKRIEFREEHKRP